MKILPIIAMMLLTGCLGIPEQVQPVRNFNLENYLGRWYEIARLDHSFERGLTHVTADYSLREGGGLRVINRGFHESKQRWKQAEGRAYFVEAVDQGYLKVSFFGPFYGSYVIFELDHESYQYALVCGPTKAYLWVLSRTPEMPRDIRERLIAKAAAAGFDTSKLIYVDHQ